MSIEFVMPSSHLILCRPLLLLPPIPPSIRVFSNESTLHMRWPKYWSFSFSIVPSKEIPGLISFRMDWLDLLAVQRLLQRLKTRDSCLIISHSSPAVYWSSYFGSTKAIYKSEGIKLLSWIKFQTRQSSQCSTWTFWWNQCSKILFFVSALYLNTLITLFK